jgi:hypothetical protein
VAIQKLFTFGREPGSGRRQGAVRLAPMTMEHVFDHPLPRVFASLAAVREYRRFVPNCRESRVLGVTPLETGREIRAEFVLESKRFNVRRRGEATIRVDRARHEIALAAGFGGSEFAADIAVYSAGPGRTGLRADIHCPPQSGMLRFVPMRPLVRRGFQKAMRSVAHYLDRQRLSSKADEPGLGRRKA